MFIKTANGAYIPIHKVLNITPKHDPKGVIVDHVLTTVDGETYIVYNPHLPRTTIIVPNVRDNLRLIVATWYDATDKIDLETLEIIAWEIDQTAPYEHHGWPITIRPRLANEIQGVLDQTTGQVVVKDLDARFESQSAFIEGVAEHSRKIKTLRANSILD